MPERDLTEVEAATLGRAARRAIADTWALMHGTDTTGTLHPGAIHGRPGAAGLLTLADADLVEVKLRVELSSPGPGAADRAGLPDDTAG